MIKESIKVFMDDFSVFGDSFDKCLNNLDKMLQRCRDAHLSLIRKKCHFMVKEGIVLGHKVSSVGLEFDKAKIDVILKLPSHTNIKGVRSFLRHAGFHRRFIIDFSKISCPLTKLHEKDTPFEFSEECQKAFKILKEKLTCALMIVSSNWNLPFEVMCNASDFAVGAVLEIKDRKGTDNVAADHLSRIKNDESIDDNEVNDKFPGETLMEINTKDKPWFTDFANYLILDSRGAIPSKTVADAKVAIQEMAEYSQNRHSCCQVFISAGVLFLLLEYSVPAVRLYNSRYGRGYQSTLDPRRPFLSTACAKIDVYKRKITLRVGEERIIFTSIKPVSSLIKRVYILSLRERMELDLEVRLMGETLVLNRSLDPSFEDCIELNDLNEPIELRRSQGNELMPTIEEGEVIKEFRTRDDKLDTKINDYPSYCDHDKKIHIDCAYNLKFSCMIDFVVIEDMDAYRDKVMGDAIFGEPFLREVGINAKWFEGISTIYNGNDEVPWTNERPLENRELNAIIGAWFTLWRD
nr:reverse transcriptase domain-containing protein [Tanacetum cinerariifolium]